ncbi:lecithin retinol acyltransferase family protein [Vallitaleaceae bacterium 9-2]
MFGDIIYVERKPLLWKSVEKRANPNSKRIDYIIFRTAKYRHYGIDIGYGRVVHFQGDSFWSRHECRVIESSMEEFLKDGTLGHVANLEYSFSRDEVVRRALNHVGSDFGGYSIKDNNCEHFARWCATGVRSARQSILYNYFPASEIIFLRTLAVGNYMGRILLKNFFNE